MLVTHQQFERIVSQSEYTKIITGESGGHKFWSTTYYMHGIEFAEHTVWADGLVEYEVYAHPDTPIEALEA